MKLDDDIQWLKQSRKNLYMDPEPVEMVDDLLELYLDRWLTPEKEQITLPSALVLGEIKHLLLKQIASIEFELCKRQVTDALDGICLALGEKSLCFCTEVCNVNGQWMTSRAWDNIHKLDAQARKHQFTYHQARNVLECLNIDPEYLKTLHDITDDDFKVSGDLTNERRYGQWSDTLSWFWRIGQPVGTCGSQMQECKFPNHSSFLQTNLVLVY